MTPTGSFSRAGGNLRFLTSSLKKPLLAILFAANERCYKALHCF